MTLWSQPPVRSRDPGHLSSGLSLTPNPLVNWLDGGDYRAPKRLLLGYWWHTWDGHGSGYFFGVKVSSFDFSEGHWWFVFPIFLSEFMDVSGNIQYHVKMSKNSLKSWTITHTFLLLYLHKPLFSDTKSLLFLSWCIKNYNFLHSSLKT